MRHSAGSKIASSHTTVIDAAEPVVKAARALDCVTKIRLGIIQQKKGQGSARSLRITDIDAGIQVQVRGSKTIQEIYIYTQDRHTAASAVNKAFSNG